MALVSIYTVAGCIILMTTLPLVIFSKLEIKSFVRQLDQGSLWRLLHLMESRCLKKFYREMVFLLLH